MQKKTFPWITLVMLLLGLSIFALNIQFAEAQLEGDVNSDGEVNMEDLIITAAAFGTTAEHSRWNPDADLNADDTVNMIDLGIVARNFGSSL
jgi:hypothetical protein